MLEANILDGVTASTAEINLLDGVTATTAELNLLDGVTAIRRREPADGVTLTAELNYVDGVTSNIDPNAISLMLTPTSLTLTQLSTL